MIQPQELRIGNYVEYDGKIFPVLNVDALNEYKETGDKGTVTLPVYLPDGTVIDTVGKWLSKINSIPITPDILDKIEGFEVVIWNKVVKDYFIPITSGGLCCLSLRFGYWKGFPDRLDSVTIRPTPEAGGGSVYGNFDIKHLHQLQNLYQSLTGIELTFKTN